ncbi:hypothetical protein DFJ73DRAFT_902032 [Zopfochytrium polystomum]|nr:hypothetical protein DFJ73DRAFT_902032 [Zopfochytrium polystomum]
MLGQQPHRPATIHARGSPLNRGESALLGANVRAESTVKNDVQEFTAVEGGNRDVVKVLLAAPGGVVDLCAVTTAPFTPLTLAVELVPAHAWPDWRKHRCKCAFRCKKPNSACRHTRRVTGAKPTIVSNRTLIHAGSTVTRENVRERVGLGGGWWEREVGAGRGNWMIIQSSTRLVTMDDAHFVSTDNGVRLVARLAMDAIAAHEVPVSVTAAGPVPNAASAADPTSAAEAAADAVTAAVDAPVYTAVDNPVSSEVNAPVYAAGNAALDVAVDVAVDIAVDVAVAANVTNAAVPDVPHTRTCTRSSTRHSKPAAAAAADPSDATNPAAAAAPAAANAAASAVPAVSVVTGLAEAFTTTGNAAIPNAQLTTTSTPPAAAVNIATVAAAVAARSSNATTNPTTVAAVTAAAANQAAANVVSSVDKRLEIARKRMHSKGSNNKTKFAIAPQIHALAVAGVDAKIAELGLQQGTTTSCPLADRNYKDTTRKAAQKHINLLKFFFSLIGDYESLIILEDTPPDFCPSMDYKSLILVLKFKQQPKGNQLLHENRAPVMDVLGQEVLCQGGWNAPNVVNQLLSTAHTRILVPAASSFGELEHQVVVHITPPIFGFSNAAILETAERLQITTPPPWAKIRTIFLRETHLCFPMS